ncbi:MAG: stage sporulation protein [Actinomycetota bacterium]|nr:stage sporulation protein [Actinomycetota bacterium]
MSVRRAAALVLLVCLAAVGPTSAAKPGRHIGAVEGPLRLIPIGEEPLTVVGGHRYFGDLEIASAGDGLVLSDRLPLERYLLGLNEVPTSWPAEALKAQAVAARTYAQYTLEQGPGGDAAVYGFDICASVQCQVFSGADVIGSTTGARWIAAVESTAGKNVLYDGKPILARYHSTSGGQTLNNEQAFPEEGAYPYLVGVDSPTEQGSPLFHWTVEIRLDRLTKLLQNAGLWESGRVTDAHSVPSSSGLHYPDIVFESKKRQTAMTAEAFRDAIRELAPDLYPDLYPSPSNTASGRLPETLPSNRISMFTRDGVAIIAGRGWGHGVGMSQWGAEGLALQGAGYADILAHYYTGVSIGSYPDPGPIEVGLGWGLAQTTISGSFRIVDARGKTIVKHALGTWDFRWPGSGAVSIEPPKGYGLPLNVGIVRAPKHVGIGEPTFLTVALSRPARVTTKTAAAPTGYADPGTEVKEAGRKRIVWLAPLEPGTYDVRVTANTGAVERRSEPVPITVLAAAEQDGGHPGLGASLTTKDGPPYWVYVGGALLTVLVLVFLANHLARRGNRGDDGPPSKLIP